MLGSSLVQGGGGTKSTQACIYPPHFMSLPSDPFKEEQITQTYLPHHFIVTENQTLDAMNLVPCRKSATLEKNNLIF